jgi:subtilisin family serine protease
VVAAKPPLALPTISPPPLGGRPMRWSHAQVRFSAADFAAGRALVGLATPGQGEGVIRDFRVRGVYVDRGLRVVEVAAAPGRLQALAAEVGADPRVRYIAPLRNLKFLHRRNDTELNTVDPATHLPYEWTFARIGLDKALNLSHGSPTILVGVIDSGVAPIPDLTGKVAQAFSVGSPASDDSVGHGTFIASIIASNNDDGVGLAGFCGACRLVVYKLPGLDDFSEATGIQRLVDEGVRVINISIGSHEYSPTEADAVNYAISHGVLIVAAAGNENTSEVSYPAALLQPESGGPSIGLAVGASDAVGARARYSNFGTRLSLLAPGSLSSDCRFGVFAAVPPTPSIFDDGCSPLVTDSATGARYAYSEGTSFSSPEVAGIAALLWSAAPSLKSSDVAAVLEQTATRSAGAGWSANTGWGIANAARALEYVTGKSSADRVVVSRITPAHPARPGQLFQLSAKAGWSDGVPLPSGSARCNVSVAGKLIAAKGQVAEGIAVCQWRVPKLTGGRLMRGVMSLSDPEGVTGTATFAFKVAAPAKPKKR